MANLMSQISVHKVLKATKRLSKRQTYAQVRQKPVCSDRAHLQDRAALSVQPPAADAAARAHHNAIVHHDSSQAKEITDADASRRMDSSKDTPSKGLPLSVCHLSECTYAVSEECPV